MTISIYVEDLNLASFFKVYLTQSLIRDDDKIELIHKIKEPSSPYYIIDDKIISKVLVGPNRFSYKVYNADNQEEISILKLYDDVSEDGMEKLISGDRFNPQKNKIAMGMIMLDQINIVDLNDNNNVCVTTAPRFTWISEIQDKPNIDMKVFYTTLEITDDYIFALYTNQAFAEWQKVSKPVEIHIFDWDGNGIARLNINEYLQYFAIDEINRCLYGIDHLERFYKYDLAGLFNNI